MITRQSVLRIPLGCEWDAAREAMASEEIDRITDTIDPLTLDLLLVASSGLDTMDCLRVALQMVPIQFPSQDRIGYMCNIARSLPAPPGSQCDTGGARNAV